MSIELVACATIVILYTCYYWVMRMWLASYSLPVFHMSYICTVTAVVVVDDISFVRIREACSKKHSHSEYGWGRYHGNKNGLKHPEIAIWNNVWCNHTYTHTWSTCTAHDRCVIMHWKLPKSRVYNREREYPTVNMSPESNMTFDHSHVMHVHVHWSVLFFCSV